LTIVYCFFIPLNALTATIPFQKHYSSIIGALTFIRFVVSASMHMDHCHSSAPVPDLLYKFQRVALDSNAAMQKGIRDMPFAARTFATKTS